MKRQRLVAACPAGPAARLRGAGRRQRARRPPRRTPPLPTWHYERPSLYPKQEACFFASARYVVIEASTKSGKTVGGLVWLFEQAIDPAVDQHGRHYWWVAPVTATAKIAYRRLQDGLPAAVYRAQESELCVTLRNGARIWFKGSDRPDTLYGEDVYAAVIDEASRCKAAAWHAVRTTLTATRGAVRIIGNVKGRQNWAYRMARAAEQGAPDMAYCKLTAHDAVAAGILDAAEVADAQRQLPAAVFGELYLAEPSDDGGNPFGYAAIQACVDTLSAAAPVVWGIDLGKAEDFTVAIGLDAEHRVCRVERWQHPWPLTIARLHAVVRDVPALVDSTGVGDAVLEVLQQAPEGEYAGFKFTAPSKQQLMEGLAVAIQQQTLRYPAGPIVQELETFGYEYTRTGVRYTAPDGLYDDCVCALALAVR